jgi:hypothetical protein
MIPSSDDRKNLSTVSASTVDRSAIALSLDASRPWSGLVRRQLAADAVRTGAATSGVAVPRTAALAVVDGRTLDVAIPPSAAAIAFGWADALDLLQSLASSERTLSLDEGLLRSLHWVLHRRSPTARPGQLRPGAVLPLPDPPADLAPVAAAVWASSALRTADPFWTENASVAHAVELVLLARIDRVPVVAAGRPTHVGDPVSALAVAAEALRQRLREAEHRWFEVSRELGRRNLADRMAGPCWDAAGGGVLTNAGYRKAAAAVRGRQISEQQTSRDLKALVDSGVLRALGRTRDRTYRWNL